MSALLARAALVVALATLCACPPNRYPAPEGVLESAAEVIALVEHAREGVKTLVLDARATQYSDEGVIKGRLSILIAPPDAVRFSALSPTDDLVSEMVTDGARFSSFQRGQTACYQGEACRENIGRLIPIALSPSDLAGALRGKPPLIDASDAAVAWDRGVGAYRLELFGTGGDKQILWVEHGRGHVRRAQLFEGDTRVVDVTYSDEGAVGGSTLPHRIDLKMAVNNVDLRLVYREIDVDVALPDGAFTPRCPQGTATTVLSCDGVAAPPKVSP